MPLLVLHVKDSERERGPRELQSDNGGIEQIRDRRNPEGIQSLVYEGEVGKFCMLLSRKSTGGVDVLKQLYSLGKWSSCAI